MPKQYYSLVQARFSTEETYTYLTDIDAKIGDKLDVSGHPTIVSINKGTNHKHPIMYASVIKAKYCEVCGQELP